MNHAVAVRSRMALAVAVATAAIIGCILWWIAHSEKHVRIVVPGQLVRGGWQTPTALRRIIERERIKTIVTLTAINPTDPKYVSQAKVVAETGVQWRIVPMMGSRATMRQMAQAADLLADPTLRPVFFHCLAGHHRSSLAHAAYLIRHQGWSAEAAWNEVSQLPWARPDAPTDQNDRALIHEFADLQRTPPKAASAATPEVHDGKKILPAPNRALDRPVDRGRRDPHGLVCDMESAPS